jgi:hypothetical protein
LRRNSYRLPWPSTDGDGPWPEAIREIPAKGYSECYEWTQAEGSVAAVSVRPRWG